MSRLFSAICITVAGFTAVVSSAASAEDEMYSNGYFFAGAGITKVELDCTIATQRCDSSSNAVQLGAAMFLPWTLAEGRFAVELGWADFGHVKLMNDYLDVDMSSSGLLAGLAWHKPLTPDLDFYTSVGVMDMRARVEVESVSGVKGKFRQSDLTGYGSIGFKKEWVPGTYFDVGVLISETRFNQDSLDLKRGQIYAFTLGVSQRF